MAIALDQFVRQLVGSSLMSADEVAALIAALPADKKPHDGEQLARELVRQKKLSAYQAQQVYAGKGQVLVLGNYVILDKLGQGGMGLVLKAEHQRMKRLVALKVLSPKVTKTPEALKRFQREVQAAARLEHPNIVTAYDADEAAGTHFLVMQFVDGTDLSSLVKKRGPLPLDQALDCILQAARGLDYAHQHGVVHRDIKPANLLLDRQGTIKILDMGLARLDSAGAQQDQLTGTGQIMGTVDYMAPEQAMDTKHADARADIYSLGVTLWYLLTGRPLYTGETTVEKLMAHQTKPVPSFRRACSDVSPALEAVFAKMAAKTPAARYQTMAAVIADLEPFRSGPAAGTPAVHTAVEEDSKFDEFLRGMAATSRPRPPAGRQAAPAAAPAVAAKTAPAPVADPDATQDWSSPQVGTDPNSEQSLPRSGPARAGTNVRSMALQSRAVPAGIASKSARLRRAMLRRDWWRDWRTLTAAGAGGLLLILLGIWVVVRDKEGKEVARVRLPEGGSVTQDEDPRDQAKPGTSSPRPGTPGRGVGGEGSWKLPPGSPPPAIAPFDAKKAKEHQAAWAKHLGVQVEMENSLGVRFVLIPPGEFDMGSTEAEVAKLLEEAKAKKLDKWYIDRLPAEAPKHRVRITKPFWLGRHEVTRGQFRRFVDDRGYQTEAERDGKGGYGWVDGQWKQDPRFVWNRDLGFEQADNHPVVNVSWNDVTAFCTWLSEKEGEKSHLPSEAQWEYACRAGTTTTWYSGDDEGALKEHAWLSSNAEKTHPVGQKSPNAWGPYDMHGNVWEWCQDWWGDRYYATSPMEDPPGASGGSDRVFRGGCWNDYAWLCRAALRYRLVRSFRIGNLGFRLARTVSSSLPSR
jgi:formylglycine-generating enzyme required for sulfatase activity/serine/threonine protein kinase